MLVVSLTFSGILFAHGNAAAQQRHVTNPARSFGVGVGMYSGPRYNGPAVGVYPLYYPGFYGNGMSMYGPPVPTFGPVPGTFGGADYRVTQSAPFYGTSLGWFGSRSPSPRPTPNFNYNPPAFPGANDPAAPGIDSTSMLVEVRVPIENAIVFVNGVPTKQSGNVRMFSSPPLKTDDTYQYEVRADWIIDGQKTSLTKTIKGKAGEHVVADFVN